jgi:hypothetical protein
MHQRATIYLPKHIWGLKIYLTLANDLAHLLVDLDYDKMHGTRNRDKQVQQVAIWGLNWQGVNTQMNGFNSSC